MRRSPTAAEVAALPYRLGVGVVLVNREGRVFAGQRRDSAEAAWQMPQGGIDEGEDAYKAALRELYEETNIRSVEKLGEIADWIAYDIPRDIVGAAWSGKYRGQKQKWYALRFTGGDDEIDIAQRHTEQASLMRFADKERKLLGEIDHALEKMEKSGEYGVCEGTEEPISFKRLEVRPWTRYSVAHKEQLERERKQHRR